MPRNISFVLFNCKNFIELHCFETNSSGWNVRSDISNFKFGTLEFWIKKEGFDGGGKGGGRGGAGPP